MPAPIIICAIAFVLGSIPFGLIVARMFKVNDLTERGSGNIGATNVSRVLGFWPAGALTFGLDVLKGALPVLLALPIAAETWLPIFDLPASDLPAGIAWLAGLFAVLGHCYSPWMKFKGGKGVATGFGAILVLTPIAALIGILSFVLTFLAKRIGSLASIVGVVAASIAHLVLYPLGSHLIAGAALVGVILIRHESNISALLEGNERAFKGS